MESWFFEFGAYGSTIIDFVIDNNLIELQLIFFNEPITWKRVSKTVCPANSVPASIKSWKAEIYCFDERDNCLEERIDDEIVVEASFKLLAVIAK